MSSPATPVIPRAGASSKSSWTWPVDFGQYDRSPELTDVERKALEHVSAHRGRMIGSWPGWVRKGLKRLTTPLDAILTCYGANDKGMRFDARKAVLIEVLTRGQSYWGWGPEVWLDLVSRDFLGHPKVIYLAYLIGGVRNWVPFFKLDRYRIAGELFGRATIDKVRDEVMGDITKWGYSDKTSAHTLMSSTRAGLSGALAAVFLYQGSPYLSDTTFQILEDVRSSTLPEHENTLFPALGLLSRVLAARHIIEKPLPQAWEMRKEEWAARQDDTGMTPDWFCAVCDWYRLSGIKTRDKYAGCLLKVGRWLAAHHPEIARPEQFTYKLAAELTASICRDWKIGDYIGARELARNKRLRRDQRLGLKTMTSHLNALRGFFWDLQEEPFNVHLKFNPRKGFATPKFVRDSIGPSPRTVDSRLWARIVYAALNLTDDDLPKSPNGGTAYPLEMVRAIAVVWVFSGLRSDEIARLRVGCTEAYREDHVVEWTGEVLPKDAVAQLTVPVHKTGPSFVKPVHPIIHERIEEWERVRPDQPQVQDEETGDMVNYLFSIRGTGIAPDYINETLIPLLSRKVKGVRQGEEGSNARLADAKGPLTSHRARAQIASMLHNGPVPMTLPQIQKWLGHSDIASTVHYAETELLTGDVAFANVEMMDRNLRMVQVYVDTIPGEEGSVRFYYDVGDGLCSFAEWHTCPHRLACLKCQYFVPKDKATQIRARDGVRRFLEVIPNLSEEERKAADGDEQALAELVEYNKNLPTPPDNPRFYRPLPMASGSKMRRRS